jgi:hypothetical protein
MNSSVGSIGIYATLKENVNRANISSIVEHQSTTQQDKSMDLMSKIMQEKENYIGKLE